MSSIYLHIPFCRRVCGYCDFFKSVRCDRMEEVVDAMLDEIEEEGGFLASRSLSTIYFGGGTPSLLTVDQVARFMDRIDGCYDIGGVSEVTFEANPDDLSRDYLVGLRGVGINRLSIGVQSFDDGELRFMNRRHSARQAVVAIEEARAVGFDNIAIDLIFGVSGFGEEVLSRSLDRAVELEVDHVAAYHLTIEEGTEFARRVSRGEFEAVAESVSEREYDLVRERLTRGGYEHYEISNFAKSGRRSRHNSSYWRGEEYLGIGAGAHSYSGARRRWGSSSLDEYLSGERYGGEVLSECDMCNEMVMTSLRCCEGLNLDDFESRFGVARKRDLVDRSSVMVASGDLEHCGAFLRIPSPRFLRSDMVIERLFFDEF